MLEVREESGVNDDVGMLGEVGVRLVFLAEVGFTEPDKHAGVAFEGLLDLGTTESVFEASAALGEKLALGIEGFWFDAQEGAYFGFCYADGG